MTSPSEFDGMLDSSLRGMESLDFLPTESESNAQEVSPVLDKRYSEEPTAALPRKRRLRPTWFRRKSECGSKRRRWRLAA